MTNLLTITALLILCTLFNPLVNMLFALLGKSTKRVTQFANTSSKQMVKRAKRNQAQTTFQPQANPTSKVNTSPDITDEVYAVPACIRRNSKFFTDNKIEGAQEILSELAEFTLPTARKIPAGNFTAAI